MPKPADCDHPAVVITVKFGMQADLHSFRLNAASRDMVRIGPSRLANDGEAAVLYARCKDCGLLDAYSSADYAGWPAWLREHWANILAAGGLPRQLADHYHIPEPILCPA